MNSIQDLMTITPASLEQSMLTVIDPLSRKIEVPRTAVTDTKAVHREGCPSLCLLFMEGRCRQGNDCNQVHADPQVIRTLRQVANTLPTCCQFHGDSHKVLFDKYPEWAGKTLAVDGVVVPLEFVAFTHGLQRSMEGGDHTRMNQSVVITPTFVCRLQAGGHCRYSEECKFVHLCREVTQQHLSHCVLPLSTDLERKHKNLQQANTVILSRPSSSSNHNRQQQQQQQQPQQLQPQQHFQVHQLNQLQPNQQRQFQQQPGQQIFQMQPQQQFQQATATTLMMPSQFGTIPSQPQQMPYLMAMPPQQQLQQLHTMQQQPITTMTQLQPNTTSTTIATATTPQQHSLSSQAQSSHQSSTTNTPPSSPGAQSATMLLAAPPQLAAHGQQHLLQQQLQTTLTAPGGNFLLATPKLHQQQQQQQFVLSAGPSATPSSQGESASNSTLASPRQPLLPQQGPIQSQQPPVFVPTQQQSSGMSTAPTGNRSTTAAAAMDTAPPLFQFAGTHQATAAPAAAPHPWNLSAHPFHLPQQ